MCCTRQARLPSFNSCNGTYHAVAGEKEKRKNSANKFSIRKETKEQRMPTCNPHWSRREFLRAGIATSTVISFSATVPAFWRQVAAQSPQRSDRILVVLQLSGGNDGLNTVIPFRDPRYYQSRPVLAIPPKDVLKINDELGLHPSLRAAVELWESGRMAVIQGVGYPQPNRSHFESMDIWHSCYRKDQQRRDGWLGRYLESVNPSDGLPALHLGQEAQPLALASRQVRVPSIASVDEFRLQGAESLAKDVVRLASQRREQPGELLDFIQANSQTALKASAQLEQIIRQTPRSLSYPRTALGDKLSVIARLIGADLPTRVYYLALDGFDTHSQQAAAHAGLLNQWSTAIKAFFDDLAMQANAERVLLFSFSEFGRRVRENASEGTDHGAAAPVFLFGPAVQAGIHGAHPSLSDLEDGDLKFHTDFRRVYATLLETWFGATNTQSILGGNFPPLPVLKIS